MFQKLLCFSVCLCFAAISQTIDIFIPTEFNLNVVKKDFKGNVSSVRETEYMFPNALLPEKVFTALKNDSTGKLILSEKLTPIYKDNGTRILNENGNWSIQVTQSYSGSGTTRIFKRQFSYKITQ